MSSSRTPSTAKSAANNAILTKSNLDHHNRQMNSHSTTSFTTLNDSSSESSSDRSVTPPPEFTYTRRTLTSVAPQRSPSPPRSTSLPSLPVTPTQQRRPVLKRPAWMLEGTPVRPQRPGSVSSGSFSLNRESTPSLRNTLTRIDEPSPQTPREVVDREQEARDQPKEPDFKPTPELPQYRRHDEEKVGSLSENICHGNNTGQCIKEITSLQQGPVVQSPVKRSIDEDLEPKKVRRSESTSCKGKKETQAQLSCPIMKVNEQEFFQIRKIQVGGSGVVYQVLSKEHREPFAIKEINVGAMNADVQACINEVKLLEELQGNDCVVRLHGYEMDESEMKLKVLFEFGEIDVDRYMKTNTLDIHDIRHFWRKMVEAVRLLHERRIVHSDLKPANFIIVRGRVKIIDFGIAKAINQGTQNIHRDTISGTSNYLSPEAVRDVGLVDEDNPEDGDAYALYKVGKPADIWALGIILYTMAYGTTPFSRIKDMAMKTYAIVCKKIEYPRLTKSNEPVTPELLHAMKWCLKKDAAKRPTAETLLGHRFLSP